MLVMKPVFLFITTRPKSPEGGGFQFASSGLHLNAEEETRVAGYHESSREVPSEKRWCRQASRARGHVQEVRKRFLSEAVSIFEEFVFFK